MILPPLPLPEMVVTNFGIITTNNGCTCDVHQFGCGNNLILARSVHGCGVLLHLWKTTPAEISAFLVLEDGVMVVRLALHQGSRQLVHKVICWMELW